MADLFTLFGTLGMVLWAYWLGHQRGAHRMAATRLPKIDHPYADDGRTRKCAARCGGYRSAHIAPNSTGEG